MIDSIAGKKKNINTESIEEFKVNGQSQSAQLGTPTEGAGRLRIPRNSTPWLLINLFY